MKKIRIVQFIGIILFFVYLSLIIVDFIYDYLGRFDVLILSIVLALISLNLIYKGVLIKSSSTLWFSMCLILFAIVIAIFELNKINPLDYYFIFALIPIISSLINVAIFANLIYIKVIIINISIIVPIFVMYFTKLSLWWIIGIGVFSLILGIIICRFINFNREKV